MPTVLLREVRVFVHAVLPVGMLAPARRHHHRGAAQERPRVSGHHIAQPNRIDLHAEQVLPWLARSETPHRDSSARAIPTPSATVKLAGTPRLTLWESREQTRHHANICRRNHALHRHRGLILARYR